MLKQIIILLIGIYLFPHLLSEGERFKQCISKCNERRQTNENIIFSDFCKKETQVGRKEQYGDKLVSFCETAEEENQMSHLGCVSNDFWLGSEPRRLWTMYSHSHWMLWGLTLPCLLYVIHLLFASCNARRLEDRIERLIRETQLLKPVQIPPTIEEYIVEDNDENKETKQYLLDDKKEFNDEFQNESRNGHFILKRRRSRSLPRNFKGYVEFAKE